MQCQALFEVMIISEFGLHYTNINQSQDIAGCNCLLMSSECTICAVCETSNRVIRNNFTSQNALIEKLKLNDYVHNIDNFTLPLDVF